jgi:hypothetical protein
MAQTPVLTPDQVNAWKSRGFCAVDATQNTVPTLGEILTSKEAKKFEEATRSLGKGEERTGFGGASFPFLADQFKDLNDLILHPRIVKACSELLGTDRLLLSQGEAWLKTGRSAEQKISLKQPLPTSFYDNDDQRIHMDFPNHYLVHPPAWEEPDAVAMIVYFQDARECGGRTALVARTGESDEAYKFPYTKMPGFGMLPWINNRTLAERDLESRDPEAHSFRHRLYGREEYLDFRLGTILFYRLDLWHRGTPLLPLHHER